MLDIGNYVLTLDVLPSDVVQNEFWLVVSRFHVAYNVQCVTVRNRVQLTDKWWVISHISRQRDPFAVH